MTPDEQCGPLSLGASAEQALVELVADAGRGAVGVLQLPKQDFFAATAQVRVRPRSSKHSWHGQ